MALNIQTMHTLLTQEYELELVVTPTQRQAVKSLRQQVYQEKYGKDKAFLERIGVLFNAEDEQSFIYLLKHRPDNLYVGTVRCYFVNHTTPKAPLPMNQTVPKQVSRPYLDKLPIIEISRLALIKKLPKSRHVEGLLQLHTYLSLALFLAVRITVTFYPVRYLLSIMEPTLQRILARRDIRFEAIGEKVDSYGTIRIPYAVKTACAYRATEISLGDLTRRYYAHYARNKTWEAFLKNNAYLHEQDTLYYTLKEEILSMDSEELCTMLDYAPTSC